MDKTYRETVAKMEASKVTLEYILGWQGGYLGHPKREEQRVTDAYAAGYEDGLNKETGKFSSWAED